jgi:4-amino-4-deoxy-L-arabinose transferase-like glycosyltransferase
MKNNKPKTSSVKKDEESIIYLFSPTVDTTLRKRWVELIFLGILFLIAFLIRLSILKYYRMPLTGDAAIYGKIAWGIKTGHGLHWWSVVWSPFYPLMIFVFSIFSGGLESAAYSVSIFLGSLTVLPFFFLAKKVFNYQIAYVAALLVVFFPALVVISAVPLSEATYTFFLLITVLCGWLFISKRSYPYAVLFGVLSGICYLTRPEFLVAFAFMLLVFLVIELKKKSENKKRTFALLGLSVVGFLILALPYVNFMHSQTGHWILSGKTAHNILKQEAYSRGQDYLQQRKAFAGVLDGLTPEGEVKGKVLLGKESMFLFVTSPYFFNDYFLSALAGIKSASLYFLIFFLLALFYIFSWKVDKEGWGKRVFLLCFFTPILTMPVFFVPTGRLVEPYSPILIMLSMAGILNLRNTLVKSIKSIGLPQNLKLSGFVILMIVSLLSVFSWAKANRMAEDYGNTMQEAKLEAEEFKKLGVWADKTLPRDAVVMFLSSDTFFLYCNRVTFTVPFAPFEKIVEFAKKNKIDYLVVSLGKEAYWRDDLTFLLKPLLDRSQAPEDTKLKLVDVYQAPSGLGAVVYKFEY